MWKRVASLVVVLGSLATTTAAQSVYADRFIYNAGPRATVGSGSPEAVLVAAIGSTYTRTDTGEAYLKISGAGNTGWLVVYRAGGVDVPVADGGTGVSTLAANGVLYGNGTSAILATAQGATNTVLAANAGAPAFTTSPTIGTLATTGAASIGGALNANTTLSVVGLANIGGALTAITTLRAGGAATFDTTASVGGTLTVGGTITTPAATNLTLAPTGDLITAPVGLDVLPGTNYTINLGALTNKYLTLHAAELWVETLVAQNTIATIGGRVLVAPTNILTVDQATGSTAFTFKYNNFAVGDRFYMEASGKVEFFAVTAGPTGSAGAYGYTVTRNLDGSGANLWYAGDAALNTGTTGSGFIDLYSVGGVLSGTGPAIVGNVRTGTAYNAIAPRWAIGNLNGLYGYGAATYGAVFGDAAATNVAIDATNGFRIRFGTANRLVADTSGNLSLVGDLTIGTGGVIRTPTMTIDTSGLEIAPTVTPGGFPKFASYGFGPLTDAVAGGRLGLYATDGAGLRSTTLTALLRDGSTRNAEVRISAEGTVGTNQAFIDLLAVGNGVAPTTRLFVHTGSSVFDGQMRVQGENVGVVGAPDFSVEDAAFTARFAVTDGDVTVRNVSAVTTVTLASATGAITTSGLLTSTGVGQHTFTGTANQFSGFSLGNASTGNAAGSYLYLGNSLGAMAALVTTGTGFAATGNRLTNSVSLESYTANGLSLAANGALGEIRFYTNSGQARMRIDSNGDLRPETDGSFHVGVPANRFGYMTALAFNTTDIAMDNGWSFTEAERIGIAEPGVALVDDSGELIAFFGKSGFRARGLPGQGDIDDLPYHVTTLDQRVHMDRTPEVRVKGYAADGTPITRTRADVPAMPDPKTARTKKNRAKP